MPSFKVGATIFGDYTYQESPAIADADGNSVKPSSFNVSRAYINGFEIRGSRPFPLGGALLKGLRITGLRTTTSPTPSGSALSVR